MSGSQWFVSTDMIGKPGSPKVAGPFSTREDAFEARFGMEKLYGTYSVFEEVLPEPTVPVPVSAIEKLAAEQERALDIPGADQTAKNDIRRDAIQIFLDGIVGTKATA